MSGYIEGREASEVDVAGRAVMPMALKVIVNTLNPLRVVRGLRANIPVPYVPSLKSEPHSGKVAITNVVRENHVTIDHDAKLPVLAIVFGGQQLRNRGNRDRSGIVEVHEMFPTRARW